MMRSTAWSSISRMASEAQRDSRIRYGAVFSMPRNSRRLMSVLSTMRIGAEADCRSNALKLALIAAGGSTDCAMVAGMRSLVLSAGEGWWDREVGSRESEVGMRAQFGLLRSRVIDRGTLRF